MYYYYSLIFLQVETKDLINSQFRPERKKEVTKIDEWPPSSVNSTNLKACLGVLLPVIYAMKTISKPGGPFETLKQSPAVLKSLQTILDTPNLRERDEAPYFSKWKRTRRRTVPEEYKRLRCLVLTHILKINFIKVK